MATKFIRNNKTKFGVLLYDSAATSCDNWTKIWKVLFIQNMYYKYACFVPTLFFLN